MIRLGCLARNRGQIYDASMLFKEAISINPNNADPWTLIGLLHMAKQEYVHLLKCGMCSLDMVLLKKNSSIY